MIRRRIILASASKRRSEILLSCNIRHDIFKANVKEVLCQERPAAWNVKENAVRKASKCAESVPKGSIVIAADTLVVLKNRLIGKPRSRVQAERLFKAFSNNKVDIITGLCVIDTLTGRKAVGTEKSSLFARGLEKKDINRYFIALRPYDKAGGFSIEGIGSFLYDDIKGSYFNILGLPMIKLKELLKKTGLEILDFCE